MTYKIQEILYSMSNKYNSQTDWLTISNKPTVYTLVFSVAHRNSTCAAHNETGTLIINIAISILGRTDSMPNCDVRTEIKHHRVIQRRVTTGGHCRYHISSATKKQIIMKEKKMQERENLQFNNVSVPSNAFSLLSKSNPCQTVQMRSTWA